MQITTRATVLAVALLASAPLLAADFGSSTARSDAPTQAARATTERSNCTPPALPPTHLSPDRLANLPKPGSTPPDPAEVDRRLRKADGCARALGLRAPGEDTTSSGSTEAISNRSKATQPPSPPTLGRRR